MSAGENIMWRRIRVPIVLLGAILIAYMFVYPPSDLFYADKVGECRDCNVLIIVLDAARRDHFGTYGYPKNTTPYIDRLAEESYVFEDAISQATWTKPSITSLFTSMYPSRHGIDEFQYYPSENSTTDALPDSAYTLAASFRDRGYKTHGVTDNAYVGSSLNFGNGFDSYDSVSSNTDVFGNMNMFIGNLSRTDRFFAYMHVTSPHAPYESPPEYAARFVDGGSTPVETRQKHQQDYLNMNLTESQLAYVVAQYDGKLAYADGLVGSLIDELGRKGMKKNTVIALTSDHGESFLEQQGSFGHGFKPYESLIRVPLIIYVPSNQRQRRLSPQVEEVDLMPTLINLTHGKVPAGLDGASLKPVMDGGDPHEAAYSEYSKTQNQIMYVSLRSDGWKLHCTASTNGSLVRCALHDLNADPREEHPAENESAHKENMTSQLRRYLETNTRLMQESGIEQVTLNATEVDRLKALGYAN